MANNQIKVDNVIIDGKNYDVMKNNHGYYTDCKFCAFKHDSNKVFCGLDSNHIAVRVCLNENVYFKESE